MGEYVTEIIVALIATVGTLVTTILANWEKFFPPKDAISAKSIGYTDYSDYEGQLRQLLHLTKAREQMNLVMGNLIQALLRPKLEEALPEEADTVQGVLSEITSDMNILDFVIDDLVEVYQKYIPFDTLVELNKFYSTRSMREYMERQAHITRESAELGERVAEKQLEKILVLLPHYVEKARNAE